MEMCEKEHKIIWWGTLPPSGISTLLLKSLVVLTHSKYEAGGLVLLEAFTQGLPVIATPNGYAKDYIQDWYNGFLVDYKDVHLLAKYMMFFCNQPFLSYYMGNNASQTMAAIKDSWNFMQSHLYAYGLVNSRNMTIYNPPQGDWYRKITTYSLESYPYQSNFPSETAVIKQLLKRKRCIASTFQL